MPLHLLKLAVGIESFSDLAVRQESRLKDMARRKQKPELIHITRHMPRRSAELLDGGSLYWVIKGFIAARQRLIEFRPLVRDGIAQCGLVYDPELIPVAMRPHRAFQGWRYLEDKDAPPDQARRGGDPDLPDDLKRALSALGLL
ncbi:MAG: DUF1489 domain-containing protein [Methylovirgula sp.]